MQSHRADPAHREIRARHRWFSSKIDASICFVLYFAALVLFLKVVQSANTPQLLTGEEASVSFVDPVGVEHRWQFMHFSTNFGGHVFFWVASFFASELGLFYGRIAKACAMALLAPLLYHTIRTRLGVKQGPAIIGALTGIAFPGVVSFSWVAIEPGLDSVVGLIGLLVATTKRPFWCVAPLFAGVVVSTYGGGVPWALGIALVAIVRTIASIRQHEYLPIALVAASGMAGLGIIAFPLLWWGGGVVVSGGGSFGLSEAPRALGFLLTELTNQGSSYYYFNSNPALGSAPVAAISFVAILWMAVRAPQVWPWLIALATTIALYAVSGGILGVRRATIIPIVCAMALAFAIDRMARLLTRRSKFGAILLIASTAAALLLPLAVQIQNNRLALFSGTEPLPQDFAFPLEDGRTMQQMLEVLSDRLRQNPAALDEIALTWEGERTAAIITLLSDRGAIEEVPLSGDVVERMYREGPRCESECTPVAGRP